MTIEHEKTDVEKVVETLHTMEKTVANTVADTIEKSQVKLADTFLEKIKEVNESKVAQDYEILKSDFANLKTQLAESRVDIEILLKQNQASNAGINNFDDTQEILQKSRSALHDGVISTLQNRNTISLGSISSDDRINKSVLNTFNNARFGSAFKNQIIELNKKEYNVGNLGFLSNRVNVIDYFSGSTLQQQLVDYSGFQSFDMDEFSTIPFTEGISNNVISATGEYKGSLVPMSAEMSRFLAEPSEQNKIAVSNTIDMILNRLIVQNEQDASKRIFSGKGVYANSTLKGVQGIVQFAQENINATFRTSRVMPSAGHLITREDLYKLKNCLSEQVLRSPDCALYMPVTLFDQFLREVGSDGHSVISDLFDFANGVYYFKAGAFSIPVVPVGGRTVQNSNFDNIQDFLQGFEGYKSFTSDSQVTHLYKGNNTNEDSGKVFAMIGDMKQGYTFGRNIAKIGVENTFATQVGKNQGFFGMYQAQFGMVADHRAFAIGYVKL